jgi:hypothetical protein
MTISRPEVDSVVMRTRESLPYWTVNSATALATISVGKS